MKAQELRIGNIVEYLIRDEMDAKKEWWEPSQIDAQDILWLSQNPDDEDYRPMTITEEVLVRFGFECVYKSNIHSFYAIGRGTLSYYFWYDSNNQYASFGGTKISCKNVHSLQNLCFALTSSELNINNN